MGGGGFVVRYFCDYLARRGRGGGGTLTSCANMPSRITQSMFPPTPDNVFDTYGDLHLSAYHGKHIMTSEGATFCQGPPCFSPDDY